MSDKTLTTAEAMLEIIDGFRQVEEGVRGYKVHLEQAGWNESAAEMIAANLLIDLQRKAVNG